MTHNNTWIDFRELRSFLKFADVLNHYRVQLKFKGDRATGFCPLPTHQGHRNSPSFSAELRRGIWQCFGCHARGNVLDFACRMEGFDPYQPQEFRKGALKVRDIFLANRSPAKPPCKPPKEEPHERRNVRINEPIDFELRTLDPEHPYLFDRGFTAETIRHFGLGYCNRGMLKGRVAIPLHDLEGRLVGYAGRLTKDSDINEEHPKYLFPGSREKDGQTLEFHKSLLLYNAHRIVEPVDELIVVEGFPATWWLWQAEFRNTVALMGSSCSDEQAKIIVDLVNSEAKVRIMPDGNEAGVRCAHSVFERVAPHRLVRWAKLDNDKQPTDCSVDELIGLLQ